MIQVLSTAAVCEFEIPLTFRREEKISWMKIKFSSICLVIVSMWIFYKNFLCWPLSQQEKCREMGKFNKIFRGTTMTQNSPHTPRKIILCSLQVLSTQFSTTLHSLKLPLIQLLVYVVEFFVKDAKSIFTTLEHSTQVCLQNSFNFKLFFP
jgi:hypothetical protein